MAEDKKDRSANVGRGPGNPSSVGGQINPSSPAEGNSPPSTNLAGNNPTAFKPEMQGEGKIFSRPAARDSREMTFRCADVGHENCDWEVRGGSEEDLMPQIERHGREQHNLRSFDENTRQRVLDAIHRRSAA